MPNNFEPINPEKVVIDNEIDPAKVVIDNDRTGFTMVEADRKRVREAFTGDPLGFIADPDVRSYVSNTTENFPDRDEYRKRMALAAYFTSLGKNGDFKFNLSNLDGILEAFYKKKTSVDSAYADIAQMLAPKKWLGEKATPAESTWTAHGAALLSGMTDVSAYLAATYLKFAKWDIDSRINFLAPLLPDSAVKFLKSYSSDLLESYGQKVYKSGKEISEDLSRVSGANPDFILNMVQGDFDKVSVTDFTKALVQSAPNMGMQILVAAVAPYALPAFVGAEQVAMKDYEVNEKQPDWSGAKKWTYIGLSAANEALFEMVTSKIVGGKLSKKAGAKILQRGMMKFLGLSAAKEGGSEAAQQLLSNANDLLFDIEGDSGNLSTQELFKRMFSGVLESGFVGAIYGLPEGIAGFRNSREFAGVYSEVRNRHERRVAELSAKENLTESEKNQLEVSKTILDSADPKGVVAIDYLARKNEEIAGDEEIRNGFDYAEVKRTAADSAEDGDIISAVKAERRTGLRNAASWDYNDVVDKVSEYSQGFKDTVFHVVESWEDVADKVPEDARGRAFTDLATGEIYINASKVRPHEVFEVMLHEAVGHKGLREIFKNTDLDQILDSVYREHFNEEEFKKVARRYFDLTELTDEEGRTYFDVNLENVEDQRLAAEEYIAFLAEQETKPSWWKEFLQKIRMAFAKLPYFKNVAMTDEQINLVIARSARKVRKGIFDRKSVVTSKVPEDGAGDGGVRFSVGGKYFKKWQDVIEQFKKDLEGVELNQEQRDIYDVVLRQKDKIRLRINDLNELEDIFVNFGTRKKGIQKLISVHYTGLRNPVTALEVLNIGDVIRRGELTEEGTANHPTSRRYELKAQDGATLKVIIDFDRKKDKNKSVINFYSDRTSDTGAHNVSSGIITDSFNNIPQLSENANETDENGLERTKTDGLRFSVAPQTESEAFKKWFANSKVVDENGEPLVMYHGTDRYGFSVFREDSHFTSSREYAARYANKGRKDTKSGVYAVYLSIQNPFDIRNASDRKIFTEYRQGHEPAQTKSGAIDWAEYDFEDLREFLQENYPGKYDGVILDEGGDSADLYRGLSYVPFSPTQIKSATDNIGTFDPQNPDIRFSIAEYSADDQRDIVDILKPFTGTILDKNPEEYAAYLREHGVDIPEKDAYRFAQEAAREKMKQARKAADKRRDNWLYDNIMEYRWAVEFSGSSDFKLRVSPRFEKDEKSGTFWYNPKKDQGVPVISLEELAKHVARETGKDELEIEEDLFNFYRDLTKPALRKNYTDFKKEQFAADKEAAKQAFDEFMQQEQYRIEDEAVQILSSGNPITEEWINDNRKVFKALYSMIFKDKTAPAVVSKKDLEAINAALMQEGANASTYAEAYKVAREKAYEEYTDKLRELREKVLQQKTDAMKLQRDAAAFAEKNLPKERRSEFIRSIINLLDYSNAPSTKYPEGRRRAEFDRIIAEMTRRAAETRKEHFLEKIAQRLNQLGERVDSGRKVRGVRDIGTQEKLNRIIQISRLDGASINAAITEDQKNIETLISNGESTADLEYDIALLNRYGELWKKSADEIQVAFNELQLLAKTGKDNLLREINARAAADENDRNELWQAVNGGKKYSSTELHKMKNERSKMSGIRKLLDKSYWPTLSLDGMFEAMAVFSSKDNVFERFRRMAHQSTLDKETLNLQNADDCQKFLFDLLHTKSRFAVAEKIGEWRKLEKNTGIRRFVPDPSEQQFKYERISLDEARQRLDLYDSGKKNMPDYEAEAIRQQLLTIDRKIKYEIPEEFRDGATDKIIELIKKDMDEKEPTVVIPRPTFRGTSEELELSQLQAIYLKLMWEQKDIRYKMHYNGYSEETMRQIDSFLLPEVKAFGNWMRRQLELDRTGIAKVFKDIYFANFPKEENYFPSVYNVTGNNVKTSAVDLTQEGAAAGSVAYTPGALKVRVYHLKDIQVADALTVFQNHRLQMNHFVTHAEAARKMRSVLLNNNVKQAIEGVYGDTAYREMKAALQDFINGGNTDVQINDFGAHIYSAAVKTKMAFNLVSGLKQTMGSLTYIQEIPPRALVQGLAYAATHPKEVFETLGDTDYFKARWSGGANADLRLILDVSGKQGSKAAQFFKYMDEVGSLPLRLGDASSVLFGGFAVYKYHFDNLVKQGMSEKDARKEALLKWEMATERTQQSSSPFLLNRFQRGGYLSRTFTTFMSNQILLWNHNSSAVYKSLIYGDKAALKDAGMGIAALLLSSAAMTAFDQLKEHWNDGEYEWWDLIWNALADAVTGFGPLGSIASSAIQAFKPGGRLSAPIWSDVIYGGYAIKRQLFDEDAKLSDKDWADAVKILQAAGYFYQPLSPVGNAARELRKWYRIINE